MYTNTRNYTSYSKEKYRKTNIIIIHKKINLNDHFTVPGFVEIKIGLGRKIGISQNWRELCTWKVCWYVKDEEIGDGVVEVVKCRTHMVW